MGEAQFHEGWHTRNQVRPSDLRTSYCNVFLIITLCFCRFKIARAVQRLHDADIVHARPACDGHHIVFDPKKQTVRIVDFSHAYIEICSRQLPLQEYGCDPQFSWFNCAELYDVGAWLGLYKKGKEGVWNHASLLLISLIATVGVNDEQVASAVDFILEVKRRYPSCSHRKALRVQQRDFIAPPRKLRFPSRARDWMLRYYRTTISR